MNQKDRDALQEIADQVAELFHKLTDYQADEQSKAVDHIGPLGLGLVSLSVILTLTLLEYLT